MLPCARNHGHICYCCVSCILVCQSGPDVKVPGGGVQVVLPNLDPEHEILLGGGCEGGQLGIRVFLDLEGSRDGCFVEGFHDHVCEATMMAMNTPVERIPPVRVRY